MAAAAAAAGGGPTEWAERSALRRADRLTAGGPVPGRLRFVFYGRVSTEDWQDPVTSRARQREQAGALVRGHGQIVAEFFDVGQTRKLAWACRPQSAALVAQLADSDRGWDAIVIGKYERAFYGSQYAAMAPLFEHYGVQLWTPEAGGRVDFKSEHDEKTMTMLGLSSKREITRTSIRVRAAMAVQTREQGRYLGGRPPYGYRLADAGNRQRTDTELADPANVTLGHKSVQRWNLPDGWVISSRPAHPALVSEDDFVAAQGINAARGPVPHDELVLRRYLLAGLLACGLCGRRMESAWSNGRAAYRCRHGRTSAMAPDPARPRNTYIREDKLLPHLPALHLLLISPAVRARRRTRGRRRCQEHREPGRGDRVPARARDHPHLEPGRRSTAGTRHPDCQDRHRDSTLTRLQSPDQEGRQSSERRSPGARGSLRAGDDPACPETGGYGVLLCPRT